MRTSTVDISISRLRTCRLDSDCTSLSRFTISIGAPSGRVSAWPAQYGPRTHTRCGLGFALDIVRFGRSGELSSPSQANFASNAECWTGIFVIGANRVVFEYGMSLRLSGGLDVRIQVECDRGRAGESRNDQHQSCCFPVCEPWGAWHVAPEGAAERTASGTTTK